MRIFVFLMVLLLCIKHIKSSPTPPPTVSTEIHNIEHVKIYNKSEETPNNQNYNENTESKQIPDTEPSGYDYPVVTKKEAEYNPLETELDLDQLKVRCLHLQKLLKLKYKPTNYDQTDDYRPIYVTTTQKPTTPKPTYPPPTRPNSFYITAPPQVNRRIPTPSPIRYIRLEPVILQKTILNNGRTIYYWHKSLPTAIEQQQPKDNGFNPYYNYYYNNPNHYIPPHNYWYPHPPTKPIDITTTEPTTTTTTTEDNSYSYGFSHFIPFYGGSSGETTSTTTTTIETPTTTTSIPKDDILYAQQLKFVVPVPYDGVLTNSNWGYNPYYNIYDNNNNNNHRVPYGQQLQYVRAVVVPKVELKNDDDEIDEDITK